MKGMGMGNKLIRNKRLLADVGHNDIPGVVKDIESLRIRVKELEAENERLKRVINEICDDAQRIVEEYRISEG